MFHCQARFDYQIRAKSSHSGTGLFASTTAAVKRQATRRNTCGRHGRFIEIEHLSYGSVSKPCTPGEHQNSW